jgi:hypothetical protein
VTHFTECELTNWTLVNFLPPSQPLYTDVKTNASQVVFLQLPVGWTGPWHKDPVPQMNVFLSGCGNWTTMDGTSHIFQTGDLYFGNDQASSKGHYSQTCGEVPVSMALMQFPGYPTDLGKPCWFK